MPNTSYRFAYIVTSNGYKWDDEGVNYAEDFLSYEIADNETLVLMNGEIPNDPMRLANQLAENKNSFLVFSANPVIFIDFDNTDQNSIDTMIQMLRTTEYDISWPVIAPLLGVDLETGEHAETPVS